MKSKFWITLVIPAILTAFTAAALAATPTSYVKDILNEVMGIQNNPGLSQQARKEAIRNIIRKNFDFDRMSKDSLGNAYNSLNASQRKEFQDIFSALFTDSYTRLVLNFLKQETVQYHKEQVQGNQASVDTTLIRTNEKIPVDYLMARKSAGWVLYDVIVDGVSILDNYKRQFARVMSTNSFDYLMDRLRTQYRSIQ
ncbi:MAG: ABC transporter substrate-binding protein [Deltaproteobacteria bacterium]|nr:ABC transporter substrate-binding protein [Deltaproteobacteria bacterium]